MIVKNGYLQSKSRSNFHIQVCPFFQQNVHFNLFLDFEQEYSGLNQVKDLDVL